MTIQLIVEKLGDLGLPVEKPSDELYQVIRDIHVDIRKELET